MSDENKPTVELYIKASDIDKSKKGSCPLCHQWFMMSYVMSERGYIDFSVTVISPANLPTEFRKQTRATKFPVVFGKKGNNMSGQSIADIVADSIDEIEVLFESFGCRELVRNTPRQADALSTYADLYKTFNILLQKPDDEKIRIRLNSILKQINDFYESNDTRFLTGDNLTYADCALIPKLQHIKIAGREYCNYEIPRDLKYLWMYLTKVYESPAFVNSCPSDQDIICHYMLKAARKVRSGMPSVQKPTYDFAVPTISEDNEEERSEDNGPVEPEDYDTVQPENNGSAEPEDNSSAQPEDNSSAQTAEVGWPSHEDYGTVQTDNNDSAQPEDNGSVQPGDVGWPSPEDNSSVQPDDVGWPSPEDNSSVQPGDVGWPSPEDNSSAEPDPPAENEYESPVAQESPREPDSYEQRGESLQHEEQPDVIPNGTEEQQQEVTSSQDSEAENMKNQTVESTTKETDQTEKTSSSTEITSTEDHVAAS